MNVCREKTEAKAVLMAFIAITAQSFAHFQKHSAMTSARLDKDQTCPAPAWWDRPGLCWWQGPPTNNDSFSRSLVAGQRFRLPLTGDITSWVTPHKDVSSWFFLLGGGQAPQSPHNGQHWLPLDIEISLFPNWPERLLRWEQEKQKRKKEKAQQVGKIWGDGRLAMSFCFHTKKYVTLFLCPLT